MTSCSTNFGSKCGKCLKASRECRFEAKCNPKTLKDVKCNALQNDYLFLDFYPQIQNFHFFSKINAFKIKILGVGIDGMQKIGIDAAKIHTSNIDNKFQTNIFIFGRAMVKKNR